MPWAVAAAGIGVAGSVYAGNQAKGAAQTQQDAAAAATAQNRQDMQPWTQAGSGAVTQLSQGLQPGGQFNRAFTMADATNSSAEKTALDAGKTAIDNSAAAKGGLLSTNNIQDNTKFAESNAASFQNQAFNQWLQTNQQQMGGLESVAGTGQSSAQNVADSTSNLTLAAGNAGAAGQVGAANAYTSGANNLATQLGTIGKLFGTSSPSTVGSATPTSTGTIGGDAASISSEFSNIDYSLSDRRLKTDMKRVGKTDDGIPIYTYRMKGGGKRQMGVVAQDVEKVKPHAVAHDSDGIKMVNYAEV